MTELDSPETHIYISTRGYRECKNIACEIEILEGTLSEAVNTNRLPSDNSQERKIRFKIDLFTKCQTNTVKKHTPLQ